MPTTLTRAQLRRVAAARKALADKEDARRKLLAQRNKARATAAQRRDNARLVAATGGTERQNAAANQQLQASVRAQRRIDTMVGRLDHTIGGLRDRLDDLIKGFGDPWATVSGEIPIALFPVRLETRFVGASLKVRIYPDVVHVDQLEEQLTAEEQDYGRGYWQSLWDGVDPDAAWEQAISGKKTNRVAWIIDQTRPSNDDQIGIDDPVFADLELRPKGPTQAPEALMLPGRWTVVGYRNGSEVVRKETRPVRHPLPVGVAPDVAADANDSTIDRLADRANDEQDTLAIDNAVKWLVDFEEAVAAGMALTITANDDARIRTGYDRLAVVGVDHRSAPDQAAARLERSLRAHYYTDGFGFVATGTPTNASDDDTVDPRALAGNPSAVVQSNTGNAADLSLALGLGADTIAHRANGASDVHGARAQDMATALWEPTMGYFLRQILEPIASDRDIARVREHTIRHVRARGPLPTLRFGAQPLGILPITSVGAYTPQNVNDPVAAAVKAVWLFWTHSTHNAFRLGDGDDPASDLVALLQRTHRSVTYQLREILGPVAIANSEGMNDLASYQTIAALFMLAIMGVTDERPDIVDMAVSEDHRALPIPLVTGVPGDDPLTNNYIQRVQARVSSIGGFGKLKDDAENASTLLEALLVHAADLEFARATAGLIIDHMSLDIDLISALADPELILTTTDGAKPTYATNRISDARVVETDGKTRLNIATRSIANGRLQALSGNRSVADHIAAKTTTDLRRFPPSAQFAEFRSALARLKGLSTRALHELTADTLDIFSYRYDAWATSLATRRLRAQRRSNATGVHIGGYGWVEDLRPRSTPNSAGLIHAPSIAHATTAAILRSGHLARSDADDDPLAINLTSRRTRVAKRLVDGMRSGQSLAALLGYRWERALRDNGPEYAAYILPVRQAHPLPETRDRETTGPVETIAARNVADGIKLAELDSAGRATLFSTAGVTSAHASVIRAELNALADALDAVGDLLMAEGVYQTVLGNSDRAAAALDALDRQTPLPEVGVIKTPRTGHGIGHRVLLVLDRNRPPAPWRSMTDSRGNAAPRVNAWIGRVLGDPTRYGFAAVVIDANGDIIELLQLSLADLGLSPLSCVLATTTRDEEASEFERRLRNAFHAAATSVPEGAQIRAQAGPSSDSPGLTGLGEFLATAAAVVDLLASARPADSRDLTHPTTAASPNPDAAEIERRANTAISALQHVAAVSPESIAGLTGAALADLLDNAAALGLPGVPGVSATRAQLETLAADAVRRAGDRLASVNVLASPAGESAFAAANHHRARLHAVFGEDFPAVPVENLGSEAANALNGPTVDPAMLEDDLLAPTEWLQRHTYVRPGVDRLWLVLSGAEARESRVNATQLSVSQLPHELGKPWIARQAAFDGDTPTADLSIVMHRTSAQPIGSRVAALAIDQWNELVPSKTETTGVSFHFDGPGARAPQTALLAVHPEPDAAQWSEDVLLDILSEASQLTKMRALDLDDVGGAGRFLPACYLPFDFNASIPSFDWAQILEAARRTWSWLEDNR